MPLWLPSGILSPQKQTNARPGTTEACTAFLKTKPATFQAANARCHPIGGAIRRRDEMSLDEVERILI
jgi:hypothetical protein